MIHQELSNLILRCFYNVHNQLGHGFLEKIYERALMKELKKHGLEAQKQVGIKVYYDGEEIGDFFADIIVNDLIILELKAVENIIPEHEAQLINYLRATKIELGFLLNFGQKAQFKRMIFTNDRKKC